MKKRAVGVLTGMAEGRKRKYNYVSEEKLKKMMEFSFEARSEAKIKWAVRAFRDWRNVKLDSEECEEDILFSDIDEPSCLSKDRFEVALCRFIVEVKKYKEDEDYPGRTLYHMACALQNHLKKHNIMWKLVHGTDFQNFNRVLDRVMQERSALRIGTVRRQAQVISLELEDKLWKQNVLGEDTPDKLRSTVLYLLGVNCALRAGYEHYALRHPGGCTTSQLSFEANSMGINCLVYREDTVTKTNRGGLRDMKKERKIVWIKPNKDVKRCPVRIVQKYINLLPRGGVKPNLYLHSLKHTKPSVWYGSTPLGVNKVRSVVKEMLRNAGLDGFFTNHSLRRTAATRLYHAGENVKLIKEVTGHISDAVEKYETTSDAQRMRISSIIQGESHSDGCVEVEEQVGNKEKIPKIELKINEPREERANSKIAEVLNEAIQSVGNRRARLTLHIDLLEGETCQK